MTTSLADRLLNARPLLLDGASGTELHRRGVATQLPLWSAAAIESAPQQLLQIHADYVAAGAEVITANTFRTHARTLQAAGIASPRRVAADWTNQAVQLARQAADGRAWVVGSQAPLEDCYSPQLVPDDEALRREHGWMAEQLAGADVDAILVETHNTVREAVAAARAAAGTGLPTWVGLVCGVDGRMLSGETVSQAAEAIMDVCVPAALLVNCCPAPNVLAPLEELAAEAGSIPIGAYANIGRPDATDGWVNTDAEDPNSYASYAGQWLDAGAQLIGGCCGTTPGHIQVLAELIDQRC